MSILIYLCLTPYSFFSFHKKTRSPRTSPSPFQHFSLRQPSYEPELCQPFGYWVKEWRQKRVYNMFTTPLFFFFKIGLNFQVWLKKVKDN
jgi:hypothetical protein